MKRRELMETLGVGATQEENIRDTMIHDTPLHTHTRSSSSEEHTIITQTPQSTAKIRHKYHKNTMKKRQVPHLSD